MNILMVLEGEFPPDERVEKEAISLISDGHQVSIVCYTRTGKPAKEMYKGIRLYRMPISKIFFKLSAACLVFPVYFYLWRRFILSLFEEAVFDVIHVHDLPLSSVGYWFKRKFGTKLVCDQHEYYSNWIIHTAHYNTPVGKIIKFLSNWTKYEKKYLSKADLVITVEEPLREIYINVVGLSAEKIICLPNAPSGKIFEGENFDEEILSRFRNRFILFYAGGIDILRGLDVAIKSLPRLKNEIPDVMLLLCGKIVKPYNPIDLADKLGVSDSVHFDGWSPIEKLPTYIKVSDICLFTPPSNRDEINKTIATKIYQYLQMGKPVIVGQAKMMKEFVETNEIGYVINESSVDEFTDTVLKFYRNKESEEKRILQNCRKIKTKYVWEGTVCKLLDNYKRMENLILD
ncbi:MAG: glycosyltransferase family 4 protein [Prolixibacteraceae bacterium]|jgi:glycosyltransferase involved in cell wall biosynthesis